MEFVKKYVQKETLASSFEAADGDDTDLPFDRSEDLQRFLMHLEHLPVLGLIVADREQLDGLLPVRFEAVVLLVGLNTIELPFALFALVV